MSEFSIRVLNDDNAVAVHKLLAGADDETLLLRSNICHGGFAYEGRPLQAKYMGAFLGDRLVGMTSLCWNGMVLVYAPSGLAELLEAIRTEAAANGPYITGLGGPTHQLHGARALLGIADRPVLHDVNAGLFALNLKALRLPSSLKAAHVTLRRAEIGDLDVLVAWDIGYRIEALGETNAAQRRNEIVHANARQLEHGADHIWVLEHRGKLVARSMFGATLPDMVQIGGVWTPPGERGKGYARAVVAGSLREAAARRVQRAVLFAHEPHAIRAYESIGFERVGGYTLTTLAEPMMPAPSEHAASASSPRCPKAA